MTVTRSTTVPFKMLIRSVGTLNLCSRKADQQTHQVQSVVSLDFVTTAIPRITPLNGGLFFQCPSPVQQSIKRTQIHYVLT